ncbi:MAG: UDP-N-acetylmuramoyl-L-alanine--D-glutamate ligase, partial [Candidatus Latescibacteria bacterium]|nr:UDP-N-acetylmuramoyl-L-alanine--D-glutamate ligase [Candidatus Latescibacterota bacterium]
IFSKDPIRSFRGRRVTVIGLGSFGGGIGATTFLVRKGAFVTVTDLKREEDLRESIEALREFPVTFHLGGHQKEDFEHVDLIVVNPAVRLDSEFLQIAREHGVPMTTEMNLFFQLCRAPIIGITGSSGKTTTTSLIGEMLKKNDPRTPVGGNIGRSLLDEVERITDNVSVVLELSSFQLQALREIGKSPHLAVVTNFAPNHIDYHGSIAAYVYAKQGIVCSQRRDDVAILNADDAEVRGWAGLCPGRVVFFSRRERRENGASLDDGWITVDNQRVCRIEELFIPGWHNVENALAATAAAKECDVPPSMIAEVLRTFRGVEHRLELAGEFDGVAFYNDSKATTPEATIAALNSFEGKGILLIAGGYDKGAPFDRMAEAITGKAKRVLLIGATAEKIETLLRRIDRLFPVDRCLSLEEAVERAAGKAVSGEVVLLSPGCASYDMFRNFEERGKRFKEVVTGMLCKER